MTTRYFSPEKRRHLLVAIGGNSRKPRGERIAFKKHARLLGINLSTYARYKKMTEESHSGSIPLDAIPDRPGGRGVSRKRAAGSDNVATAKRLLALALELLS